MPHEWYDTIPACCCMIYKCRLVILPLKSLCMSDTSLADACHPAQAHASVRMHGSRRRYVPQGSIILWSCITATAQMAVGRRSRHYTKHGHKDSLRINDTPILLLTSRLRESDPGNRRPSAHMYSQTPSPIIAYSASTDISPQYRRR